MIIPSQQKVGTSKIPGNRWRIEQPFSHRLAHHLAFTKSAQEPGCCGELCAGMGIAELRRLRQLTEENRKPKQFVADPTLDKHMLQEVIRKKL
jgi:hypothetical protein